MRTTFRITAVLLGLTAGGCASQSRADPDAASPPGEDAPGILPSGFGAEVDGAVARIRAATARFRDLDNAVAAGYARDVKRCVDHPPDGAMGYHHTNASLLDGTIQLEKPEILVYERDAHGEEELTGVEYVVPFSAWTSDDPPTVMGQKLERAPALGIWYRHVWVWRANPSGLFYDWNPDVTCHP